MTTTSLQGTDDGAGFGVQGVAVAGDGVIGTTQTRDRVGIRGIHPGHINVIAVWGELGSGEAAVQGVTGNGSRLNNVGDAIPGCGVRGDSSMAWDQALQGKGLSACWASPAMMPRRVSSQSAGSLDFSWARSASLALLRQRHHYRDGRLQTK